MNQKNVFKYSFAFFRVTRTRGLSPLQRSHLLHDTSQLIPATTHAGKARKVCTINKYEATHTHTFNALVKASYLTLIRRSHITNQTGWLYGFVVT